MGKEGKTVGVIKIWNEQLELQIHNLVHFIFVMFSVKVGKTFKS